MKRPKPCDFCRGNIFDGLLLVPVNPRGFMRCCTRSKCVATAGVRARLVWRARGRAA